MRISKNSSTFAPDFKKAPFLGVILHRGVEQLVARQAHNLEVARSNPASATKKEARTEWLALFLSVLQIVFVLQTLAK